MLRKNIILSIVSASMLSITVQAEWTDGLSKNERAAFCNFYAYVEGFLTSLQLGSRPEDLRFSDNEKRAHVSRGFRNNFQKKWEMVAKKKGLREKVHNLCRLCLKKSSSARGRKHCEKLKRHCLYGKKEELLAALAMVQSKNNSGWRTYGLKCVVQLKPCRDK